MRRFGLVLSCGLSFVALLPVLLAVALQAGVMLGAGAERSAGQISGNTAFRLPDHGSLVADTAQDGVPAPEVRERRQGRKGGLEPPALLRTTWGDKDVGTWVDQPPQRASWARMATTAAESCALRCTFLL